MSCEANIAAAKAQICADIAALQATVAAAVQVFELAHPGLYINELHSIPDPDPGIAPQVMASVGLRDSRFI